MQPKASVVTYLPLILTGVLLNACAQLLLKEGMRRVGSFAFAWVNAAPVALKVAANPFIWAGLSCYGVSVLVWLLVLSRVPVGVAYSMLSVGYIVTAVAGWYLFGEALSPVRVSGIFVIILGVYLVSAH